MGIRSAQQQDLLAHLRVVARKCGGEDLCELRGEPPAFLWLYGTTMVEASAERDGAVFLRAYLVLSPRQRVGLDARLALFTALLPFGRLEVDGDGDIALVHRLAPGMPADRFEREICGMCRQADRLDDILCEELGGMRAVDKFQRDVLAALGEPLVAIQDDLVI